jgi:hypothetical protein
LSGVFDRIWLALAATLFVNAAFAQEQAPPPARELLKPPKKHQVASPITDRFALRVTYFAPSVDTFLRLDRQTGQAGTELIAEEDLDLEDKPTQARAEMIFRLRERTACASTTLSSRATAIRFSPHHRFRRPDVLREASQTMIDWRQPAHLYAVATVLRSLRSARIAHCPAGRVRGARLRPAMRGKRKMASRF